MSRSPVPPTGAHFSAEFGSVLASAVAENPSIHDGAIAFLRSSPETIYTLRSWSLRIISRYRSPFAEPNRGSAYNSALSISLSLSVDASAIIFANSLDFFVNGRQLDSDSTSTLQGEI